jgi:type IV pilus assembly protein PilB
LLEIGFHDEDFEGMQMHTASEKGCARCNKGYRGRFPILETLPMSNRIKRLVIEGKSADDIKIQALEEGMLTLRRVGILNVVRGVTSLEEVLRITLED